MSPDFRYRINELFEENNYNIKDISPPYFVFTIDELEATCGDRDKSILYILVDTKELALLQDLHNSLLIQFLDNQDHYSEQEKNDLKERIMHTKEAMAYLFLEEFPDAKIPQNRKFFRTEDEFTFQNIDGNMIKFSQQ